MASLFHIRTQNSAHRALLALPTHAACSVRQERPLPVLAAHDRESRQRTLPETSNCYRHPGRAGGSQWEARDSLGLVIVIVT